MIKKLFLLTFILVSISVLAQTPILKKFRIEPNKENRIYFEATEDPTGLTDPGFIISGGISMIGKIVKSDIDSGYYFELNRNFSFWDNNTIRLENGDGRVNDFTLTYIENKIPEPRSKEFRFVSATASGDGNGKSEATAWTIEQADANAKAGMTIWIKAGHYKNKTIKKAASGSASNPIKFIGYKSKVEENEITSNYYNDRYFDKNNNKYTNGSLDPTEMPLFDGGDRKKGTFYDLGSKKYNIWKNVQFTGYSRVFRSASMDGFIGHNILIKNIGHGTSNGDNGNSAKNGNGNGFSFQSNKNKANKIRLNNCTVINATKHAYEFSGNHNMLVNCKAYCDEVDLSNIGGITTDYYYILDGSNNIIKDCLALKNTLNGKGHHGHGISIKSANQLPAEYNLVDGNEVINCGWGIQARWMNVKHNVYKNNTSRTTLSSSQDQVAYIIKDGADYNIFENNTIKNIDDGFWFEYGKEDPTANHAGSHNIIINNLFYNLKDDIISFMGGTNTGNKIYNNTFYNISGSTFSGSGTFSNCEFKNNILQRIGTSNKKTGWTIDKNRYDLGDEQGANFLTFDPKFQDPSKGDFRLKKESELIDKGLDLKDLKTDFAGEHRLHGDGPDLGAYEFVEDGNTTGSVDANGGLDMSICIGESATLTASGGTSYVWSSGETTASINISPTETTKYTVTVSNGTDSDTDDVIVTVNQPTSVNAGSDVTICLGENVTLTASGNGNFLWSTGETTSSITVSPTTTTTYTVTASNSCADDTTDQVVVIVTPGIALSLGNDVELCSGESITLTAQSNGDFLWNTGAITSSITVNPATTTTYSVTSTLGDCSMTEEVIVAVNQPPSVNAGSDVTICSGENVTLIASGEGRFLWSTGETTSSIIVSPTSTSTYTVTASNSCSDDASDDVIVNVNQGVTLNASPDVSICTGESVTLTAIGNSNFQWSTGETTASITVNPSSTTTYSVISSNGTCSKTDEVIVSVSNTPLVNVGGDLTICSGDIVTLTATGSGNFLWSTGETSQSVTVSPTSTTKYTVTASNSCSSADATDEVIITVTKIPTVTISDDVTIQNGSSTVLTASGNGNFLWSTGETNPSITVNPTTTTTYTVTLTSLEGGCSSQDNVIVNVSDNSTTTVNVDAIPDQNICLDESVTLIAAGGSNYLWSTGETTASITVSPTETTIYAVTISNGSTVDVEDITIYVDETCSGIANRLIDKVSKIYPNPTQGELNIELAGFNHESNISVFDLNGRLVYSENIDNYSPIKILKRKLNLSKFGKGIYFVRLINNNTSATKKVLVI